MSLLLRFAFKNIRSNRPKHFFEKSTRGNVCLSFHAGCSVKRHAKCIKIREYSTQKNSEKIVKSPFGEISPTSMLLHEKIFYNWSLWENKVATQCAATGRKYKFRDIRKGSQALAAAFQNKFKMEKGDTIAVVLPNCPEYVIIMLAVSQAGVNATLVNPLYTPYEIQRQVEDCRAKLIITSSAAFEKCFQVAHAIKKTIPIVVLKMAKEDIIPDGSIDFRNLLDPSNSGSLNPVKAEPDDVVVIPYSSGTTGSPKGVLLTHRCIVSNLLQISHPETNLLNPTTRFHQDKIMAILPMYHVYGLMTGAFYSLSDGCRVISLPKFDPVAYVQNIFKNQVHLLYVVPPLIKLLSDKRVNKFYLRSINFILNAASPMVFNDVHKLLDKAPHIKVVQGYGMTESPVLSHTSPRRMQKLGPIGVPVVSTLFKVANLETNEALGQGEIGELRISGPQVMKGYLNRPEETKEAFDGEGFLRTGDMVYFDEDGDFFVVDRLKDLIKVKGFQVAPTELEEVLRTHPKIKDAAVVGVKHATEGEVPKAFIILKKDARLSEEEIKDFVKGKLSHYKQLKGGVVFVDDFPRNSIGKVLRKQLKEE